MLASLIRLAIGLIGIGFVVVVHEIGHLVAARASGIIVEVFSVGMGPRLAGWQVGNTEFRISLLPIGGYCRMKGSDDLARALEMHQASFDNAEEGSLFAVTPMRRVITYAAGPLCNFLAAILIFTILGAMPQRIVSTPGRVVTVNDYPSLFSPATSSAYDAGIRSGDLVISFDGQPVEDWQHLEVMLRQATEGPHAFGISRDGKQLEIQASSDKTGRWGLANEIRPVVGYVQTASDEYKAGLQAGDQIVMASGYPVENNYDLTEILSTTHTVRLEVIRKGGHQTISFPAQPEGVYHFSLEGGYKILPGRFSLVQGIRMTFQQTREMASTLFSIVTGRRRDVRQELTGMGRAALMIGTITVEGLQQHADVGLKGFWYLMAIVSLSLAISNLIPLPAFDGSQIVMALWEQFSGGRVSPRVWWGTQLAGWLMVGTIMLVMTLLDLRHML